MDLTLCDDRQFQLDAADADERDAWLGAIQGAVSAISSREELDERVGVSACMCDTVSIVINY